MRSWQGRRLALAGQPLPTHRAQRTSGTTAIYVDCDRIPSNLTIRVPVVSEAIRSLRMVTAMDSPTHQRIDLRLPYMDPRSTRPHCSPAVISAGRNTFLKERVAICKRRTLTAKSQVNEDGAANQRSGRDMERDNRLNLPTRWNINRVFTRQSATRRPVCRSQGLTCEILVDVLNNSGRLPGCQHSSPQPSHRPQHD